MDSRLDGVGDSHRTDIGVEVGLDAETIRTGYRLLALVREGEVRTDVGQVAPQPIGTSRVYGGSGADVGQAPDIQALAAFRAGYRDFGGNPAWERHFLDDVILGCENRAYGWVWHPEASNYVSVAQFTVGSWTTASTATGLNNPYDLYHVGANVAWWSNAIEHPGGTGGWPECWQEGIVP